MAVLGLGTGKGESVLDSTRTKNGEGQTVRAPSSFRALPLTLFLQHLVGF